MIKTKSWLICALLFAVLLVACGDDGGDTDTAATATSAGSSTTATSGSSASETTPTEATGEATTEVDGTATSESDATATEDADTTATEDTGAAAGTPPADATTPETDSTAEAGETPASQAADPEVEAALFDVVLSQAELPEGWTQANVYAANDIEEGPTFCNTEPFAGISERLAAVEAEFAQDPQQGPFLVQNLSAYSEEQAVEAMTYAREVTTNCTEWTDDEGITYQLAPQDSYPQFGDESFVSRITFEVPGVGPVPGEFVFARVGGLLAFMGYIQVGEIDSAVVEDIANRSIEKMQAADF